VTNGYPRAGTPVTNTNEGKKNPIITCFSCEGISKNFPKKGTATEGGWWLGMEKVVERIRINLPILIR